MIINLLPEILSIILGYSDNTTLYNCLISGKYLQEICINELGRVRSLKAESMVRNILSIYKIDKITRLNISPQDLLLLLHNDVDYLKKYRSFHPLLSTNSICHIDRDIIKYYNICFTDHYINNKKTYPHMDYDNSFVLSIFRY
jgi:hypothetical protein